MAVEFAARPISQRNLANETSPHGNSVPIPPGSSSKPPSPKPASLSTPSTSSTLSTSSDQSDPTNPSQIHPPSPPTISDYFRVNPTNSNP
ncbi:MAG: hypothetical protein ABSG78_23575 [Verrucomicrobiota bacterium]